MSSDEQQPLLDTPRKPRTPLPKAQLAVVYAIKITLPIAQTQVLPYFNVFIQNLAASEGADTGYYSGLAHSVYYGAQLVSMFIWGRLSDSIGRVPVLAIGTSGTALFSVLFGFSGSLSGVLINRLLAGFFYGITGAIHSVVGELSDDTNKSIAFPLYDVVSAVAYVIGPLIGGALESPADKWPDTFSSPMWRTYPYLLPSMVSALLSAAASLLAVFALRETLPSKKKPEAIPPSELDALLSPSTSPVPNNQPAAAEPMSVKELISIPVLRAAFAANGALAFFGSCFNNVFVLMAYSPLDQGGLALSPIQIGSSLSAMGFVSIFLKLLLPPVLRARGTLSVFAWCMRVWPLAFAALPLAAWAARVGTAETKWTMVAGALFLSRLGCMAFGVVMILTRDYTPGSASLGTSNGIAEVLQSLAMTFAPSVVSSLFAISASKHLMGGYLWVVFMVIASCSGIWVAQWMRKCDH